MIRTLHDLSRLCGILPALAIAAFTNAQLVINEVDYDQESTDGAEYLELKNTGDVSFPLDNVDVLMYNGSTGSPVLYRTIVSEGWPDLAAQGYFVICNNVGATPNCNTVTTPATNLIQNGPMDAIVLMLTESPIPIALDVLSYAGTLASMSEGNGTSAEDTNDSPGVSIGRFPDGQDTQDNDADFHLMCSTPGTTNVIDPQQCDLSTGVVHRLASSSFTVLPAPGGEGIVVFDANPSAEDITIELFSADGSLLATQAAAAMRSSWYFPNGALDHGLVVVRLSTATRREIQRIVLY